MTEHNPDAVRVAKLLSAAQRRAVKWSGASCGDVTAVNAATIANLHGLGLCDSANGTAREATLTPFGLEVRAVLMEMDNATRK